jgi:hypothetical protein
MRFSARLFAHAVAVRVNRWDPPNVCLPLLNSPIIPFSPGGQKSAGGGHPMPIPLASLLGGWSVYVDTGVNLSENLYFPSCPSS